jgi:DNA repair exonuclease SbcCD nuclease subunit
MVAFLHAADLHLGLRITRFDPRSVQRIREARFQALDNLLQAARANAVDFLLIAGDLFDDHAVDGEVARRAFLMLDAAPAPVYVLPGNHDPLLPGAVWDRPPWNQAPTRRVHLLRKAEPLAAPGVVLFPCPVLRKTSLSDPTAWIAHAPPTANAIRIGIAHGSLKVRDDLPADDHLIARDAARRLQLDYLALGHWHSRQLFAEADGAVRTAYPGVHEPMRFQGSTESRTGWVPYTGGATRSEFLDAGRGEVLRVRIDRPGAAPEVTPIEVGHLFWQEECRTVASDDDLSRLIAEVATRPLTERRLLRLKLTGVLDAGTMLRVRELRQVLEGRYFFGELDETELHVRPTEAELGELAGPGILARVLDKLRAEAAGADPWGRQVAERAILLLCQMVRGVNG